MAANKNESIFKIRAAARALDISAATLRRDLKKPGKLEHYKHANKTIRISEYQLKKYKLSCRTGIKEICIEDIILFEKGFSPDSCGISGGSAGIKNHG